MGVFVRLFLIAFVLGTPGLSAETLTPEDVNQLSSYGWRLPKSFPTDRLRALIENMTSQTWGIGFRYLGKEEDLFHGHLLFEAVGTGSERRLRPRAVLYHTQEEAYGVRWHQRGDAKYDYLNVTARNWIQWLTDDPITDGRRVENARVYLDTTQKPAEPFFVHTEPQLKQHYTIHSKNLDGKLLGFEVFGDLQFEFHDVGCLTRPEPYGFRQGPISVALPNGQTHCLMLGTMNPLIETSLWKRP